MHKYQSTLQNMHRVKCCIDNLDIESKYEQRTWNVICCIQPSLSLSSAIFYCGPEEDEWKEY